MTAWRALAGAAAVGQGRKPRSGGASSATALTDCCWSGLFAPGGLARYQGKVERMALGSLIFLRSCAKPMAGRFLRRLLNLNSHNHNQRDRRRRFYLAVLIERPTSAPRYDISLLRNCASHVSPRAIPAHADCSTPRRHESVFAHWTTVPSGMVSVPVASDLT